MESKVVGRGVGVGNNGDSNSGGGGDRCESRLDYSPCGVGTGSYNTGSYYGGGFLRWQNSLLLCVGGYGRSCILLAGCNVW